MAYPMVARSVDRLLVDQAEPPRQAEFSPYSNNGGSIVAIAGEDFAIVATDTRLTSGYNILTREQPKLFNLTKKTVLASGGCWCDVLTLTRTLDTRLKIYEQEHHKQMSTRAVAQLVATMLYHRRFFPYYVSNIIAGIDENGKGALFSYDPVGHFSQDNYFANGAARSLLQPLLDNQVGLKNMEKVAPLPVTIEKAVGLIKDAFIGAAERETSTGDGVVIRIITSKGVKDEFMGLRKD